MNNSQSNIQLQGFLEKVSQEYNSSKPKYSEELHSISNKDLSIFPKSFLLDQDQTNTYRALCTLSQCGMSKTSEISSHRKYIGPVIVFFKKILNRIIEAQFKNQFLGIEACMSRLIMNHAKLEFELKSSRNGHIENSES